MDKMRMESVDMTAQNIEKIGTLFPNCITETKDADGKPKKAINFDLLRQMLSGDVLEGDEAYEFTWVGKKAAIVEANKPIRKTLRPCKEESVGWDSTENLYIEGDNLEVLKLLQESYLGKVKMIYIDPPYNTGNDFIYRDDFKQSAADYEEDSGVYDEDGNRMFKNTDTNGRFHSDWCSMMYSRLLLSRNLLADRGVIFISIDDNEQETLSMICDEVYGRSNFVGCLILQTATDNNPRQINTEHEYILCYAKDKTMLSAWASHSDKAQLIQEKYMELKDKYGEDCDAIQADLRTWIKKNGDKLDGVTHYDNVDAKGVFHDGDIANTVFGGYKYEIIHPITGKPCKIPDKGFRFSEQTMREMLANDEIMFGADETTLIKPKKRLENAKDVLRSVIYEDGRASTKQFESLMARDIFQNPKSPTILQRLINFLIEPGDVVLDFFSGSATTAEAVIQLNVKQQLDIKYIMVQLPENLDESIKKVSSRAKKTLSNAIDFLDSIGKKHNICEIGKERIRRAGVQILELSLENLEKEGVIEKYAGELSEVRSLEEVYGSCRGDISTAKKASEGRNLCAGGSDAESVCVDSVEYCGGSGTGEQRVYPVFESGKGLTCGAGNTIADMRALELLNSRGYRIKLESFGGNQQDAVFSDKASWLETLSSKLSVLSSDLGFRVLKLDDTNMKDVYYAPADYEQNVLDLLESNIKEDRTDLDLLFGCLLEWGLPLSLPYKSEDIEGCTVHNYNDGDLIACFDENIPDSVIKTIAKRQPLRAVFRDSSFASSPAKINVTQIFKELSPDTSVKVL